MLRLLGFFILIGLTVLLAMVLATTQGYAEFRVGDYLMRRSFSFFVLVMIVVMLVWGFAFHAVMRTLSIPKAISRANKENRAKKGHMALSNGLVAVASGDPDEAKKQARIASKFLDNPASSLLLTAQSAQLNGQADAAERYFEAMLDDPSTRFLGLRGLIVKALNEGDTERALGLLLEAKALKPKAPWVLDLEYQLRLDRGELLEAETAAQNLKRLTAVEKNEGGRKLAVALLAQAVDEAAQGENDAKAIEKAQKAANASPDFFAAHSMIADLALKRGNKRRAIDSLVKAWALNPSGDIANRLLAAKGVEAGDFAGKLAAAKQLSKAQPGHWASLAVAVEALMDAGQGDEASQMIAAWDDVDSEPEMAALITRLNGGEGRVQNEDATAATRFQLSAGFFACTNCGTHHEQWHSHCAQCGSTSSIRYQSRVSANVEKTLNVTPVPLIET